MGELLAKATRGIDLSAPGAFWKVFARLLEMVPWWQLIWLTAVSMAVGALLGWWRGRLAEGLAWAALLGPLGWVVLLLRPSRRRADKHPQ